MPISWLAALKIVPWTAILNGAPALARAADTLLSGSRERRGGLASSGDLQTLATRIEFLEQQDRADAELLKQVTDQLSALTTATEVIAARQRVVLIVGVGAMALAAAAIVIASVR